MTKVSTKYLPYLTEYARRRSSFPTTVTTPSDTAGAAKKISVAPVERGSLGCKRLLVWHISYFFHAGHSHLWPDLCIMFMPCLVFSDKGSMPHTVGSSLSSLILTH